MNPFSGSANMTSSHDIFKPKEQYIGGKLSASDTVRMMGSRGLGGGFDSELAQMAGLKDDINVKNIKAGKEYANQLRKELGLPVSSTPAERHQRKLAQISGHTFMEGSGPNAMFYSQMNQQAKRQALEAENTRRENELVDTGYADGTENVTMRGLRQEYNTGTAEVMKKGKTKVIDKTGNGHPRVDTVPAVLAEGEAVLNVGAAERMGRDEIKALNKQGLRDMKMDDKARPVVKKGGRLGAFSGVEMATPKMGMKGYATGVADVPAESETELANFDRQRDRNQIDEAMPYGVPVDSEPAGELGAVAPSREVARLRQNYGLTAQGFAIGTEDVQAMQPMQDPDVVFAADGEGYITRFKDVGSQAMSGLRNLFGGGGAAAADAVAPAAAVGDDAAVAAKQAAEAAAAKQAAEAAAAKQAAEAAAKAAPTSAAATSVAAKQANAVQAARMAMGETAPQAASGLRGGAGATAAARTAATAAPAAAAAAAPAAVAPIGSSAYQAGHAVGKATSGLRGSGLGAVPLIGGALTAGQALSEMPGEFFNDPNVSLMDKAGQAARSFGRAALPYVGGAIGSGVAPVAGTLAGAGLGMAAASQIDAEGEALRNWRAARPQEAAAAPAAAPAAAAAAPAASRTGLRQAGAAPGAATKAAGPQVMRGAATGKAGDVDSMAAANPEVFGVPIIRGTRVHYDDFDFKKASNDQLRAYATSEVMQGNKQAEGILKDLTDREMQTEKITGDAMKAAILAAAKASGAGGAGGATGKTGVQDMKFFDPATLDKKTGAVVPGVERPDLKEAFDGQYLPQFAASLGKRPNQLEPVEQSRALISYDLNRAAQNYALKSGKGFNFEMPVDVSKIEYVENLPMLSRIVGRARGEATWKEGFWDNGGIVITDGREKQELPIDFLEESGALSNPAMSQLIKTLKARGQKK